MTRANQYTAAELTAMREFLEDACTQAPADVGLTVDEALRIVRNMPEVETAEISMWPPWSRRLPHIPAHISVSEAE